MNMNQTSKQLSDLIKFNQIVEVEKGFVEGDPSKAIDQYQELGTANALFRLGEIRDSRSNNDRRHQSLDSFRSAANAGHIGGLFMVGKTCFERRNWPEAIQCFAELASQGHLHSFVYIGICYENGFGLEQSAVTAFDFYKTASIFDCPAGIYNVGRCYRHSIGVEKNVPKMLQALRAAGNKGSELAWLELGDIYSRKEAEQQDGETFIFCYRRAGELGSLEAQEYCAAYFALETPDDPVLDRLSLRYAKMAIAQGSIHGKYVLAFLTVLGKGIDVDVERGKQLCEMAADEGSFAAKETLRIVDSNPRALTNRASWFLDSTASIVELLKR